MLRCVLQIFLYLHIGTDKTARINTERMRAPLQDIPKSCSFRPPLFKGLELPVGLDSVDESFTQTHGNLSSISSGSFSS